jgi:hypothetical protein
VLPLETTPPGYLIFGKEYQRKERNSNTLKLKGNIMKLFRIAASLLAVILVLVTYGCASRNPNTGSEDKPANSALSPNLPTTFQPANQQQADEYGWAMFTAFSWPAASGVRGVPDPDKKIGDPGSVVWETLKTPNEVFYPGGAQPPSWEVYGTIIPPECTGVGAKGDDPVLTDTLVNRTNQASGGSLTDQNANIVHYFISFNRPIFDFVYNNGYYNIAGQDKMTGAVNFPAGAAEVKAAWRILLPSESDEVKKRFFRRSMYVYTPALGGSPATCQYQEMALLGLHFNLKVTYKDSSTQWIMATFEQVDNVPPFGTPYQPGGDAQSHPLPYSLFNKSCYNADPACVYNLSTENGRPVTTPTEVIRTSNIDPQAQLLNPQMQEQFREEVADSPWQYYEMITTQYPSDPSQKPSGNPTPATSTNTTMETYVRPSSCLGCHYNAQDINAKYFADYSFMLAQACPKPLFLPVSGVTPACTPTQKQKQ